MPGPSLERRLADGLAVLGLNLPEADRQRLIRYLELLSRWNRAYNLTAVRDPVEMVARHLLDSLSILPLLKGLRVLDVGTGAGLPGIPLAIAAPDWCFTLLDSNAKKTRFVHQVILELGIVNAEVLHVRVEEHRPEQPYDSVVTRAFASLSDILARTAHLVGVGGRWVAMQGAVSIEGLEALMPDAMRIHIVPLTVPQLKAERHAVIVEVR